MFDIYVIHLGRVLGGREKGRWTLILWSNGSAPGWLPYMPDLTQDVWSSAPDGIPSLLKMRELRHKKINNLANVPMRQVVEYESPLTLTQPQRPGSFPRTSLPASYCTVCHSHMSPYHVRVHVRTGKKPRTCRGGEFGFTANLVRKLGLKLNQGGLKMSGNKVQSQNFLAFTLLENYFTTNICLSVICVTRRFIFLPVQATAVVSQDGLLVAMAHGFLRLLVSWFQVIAHQMISLWLHLGIRACPTGLSQLPFCSLLIPLPPLWQRWVTDDEIRWLPSSRSFFENVSLLFHRLRWWFP